MSRTSLRIEDRSQRGEHRLAGLGVEVTVDAHHPSERYRGVQGPAVAERAVSVERAPSLGALAPVRGDLLQIPDRVPAGGVDERVLVALEHLRVGLARVREDLHGGKRHVARLQRPPRLRHLLDGSRQTDVGAGGSEAGSLARGEPRRRRQVPVGRIHPTPLELGEAAQPLHLDHLGSALKLREVFLDPRVGKLGEHLSSQTFQHRSQFAHISSVTNI